MLTGIARAGSVLGVAALAAVGVTSTANAADPVQGSAYAADAHVSLLPGVLGRGGITVDTGRLAPSNTGGPTSASVVDAELRGLVTAKALTSSSNYDANKGEVTSKAAIVEAGLPVLRSLTNGTPTASVISSQCHSTADGITASSNIADLNLGSIGHVSVATPNLKIGIPGVVQVIANEQIHHADGSLTVNALHIHLLGGQLTNALGSGDIVLASSTCAAVASTPTTPPTTAPPTTAPPTTSAPTTPPATGAPTTPAAPSSPAGGGGGGFDTPPSSAAAATPTTSAAAPQAPQVSVVPVGAPETGDGTLATRIVR